MANKRFIDFPIATTVGDNDIILIWQGGANKQTTKATILSGVPDSLNDLTDVTISGLTNGQILRYDSVTGQWENTDQGNLDLNDLNDVTIVSPTNGQVLVYNSSTSKWENSSGGYVPYVGAVTTVDLGLQGLEAGYVRFDTSIVSVPDEQGLMYWDASRSTVALIMNGTLQHIGQDTFFYVKNSTGSSIPKGTCVRFAGTDGASGHLLITPFLANGSVPSTYFLGVTAEEITNGSFGQVMHFGELEGINTSSYTAGDLLYASTTVAGAFQTTAPVAPNNIVLVAAAVNSKNNGAIVVRPTYGSNINNDEGVKITSPTTGDLLQLQAGGLWENKTIDAAGIVTKATNQTITGVKTFSQDIIVNGVNVGRGGGNAVENTSTGNSALSANTTGSGNTANGSFALFKNTSGGGNTALGTQSLTENTTGSGNTGLGWGSLYKNTSGSNNSALGNLSLYENTTGQTNVGIGFYALFKNTTGSDNTALGYTSGAYIADGSTANSISNNSIYIGAYTKALANNQTNQIVIGHNAIGGGSNTVVIGNSSILSNRFFGTMRIGTINNGAGDFITTDANGVLTKRTSAEVRTDIGAGTVTSVAALTLGTSGTDLSSTVANGTTTPVITLNVPTASATNRGALSAADWTTFNNKQNALTNPVTGTGTTNYLPKFTGSTTIGNSNLINDANGNLGFGVTPSAWGSPFVVSQYPYGSYFGGTTSGGTVMGNNNYYNGSSYIYQNSDYATQYQQGSGTHFWRIAPSGTAGNAISFTQAMTLDSSGRLGVGTGSSSLNNHITFTQTIGGSPANLSELEPFATVKIKGRPDRNNIVYIGALDALTGMIIQSGTTSTAAPLAIQPFGGNLLVGTSSDNGARLQVSGASTFSSFITAQSIGGSGLRIYGSSGTNQWDMYLNGANLRFSDNTGTGSFVVDRPATFSSSVQAVGTMFLQRASGGASTTIQFKNEIGNNRAKILFGGSVEELGFYAGDGSVPNLTITQSGNVGIGTPSPLSKFHVNTGTNQNFRVRPGTDVGATNGVALNSRTDDDGSLQQLTLRASDVIMLTSGNVGIGTNTSLSSKLIVNGSIANGHNWGVSGSTFNIIPSANGTDGVTLSASYWSDNYGPIKFNTSDTERMRITSGGKVLIGTETDAAGAGQRLQVTTSTSGYLFSVNNTRNVSGDLNSLLLLGNNANNTSSYYLVCSMASGDKMYIYGNGNLVNVNGSYGTLSDISLKENIKDATPKLEDILKLKVRNFNLIGSEEKQIGFIAQELEKIFPKMVDVNGINKMKSIKTSVLLPMLVKAIQELKQEIDTLKS